MKIKKVVIDNFKSIDHIELEFDKVGDSYTKIFVGINESGKSNILEALSFFKAPNKRVSFEDYCNQKFEDRRRCEIKFFLELDNPNLEFKAEDFFGGGTHTISYTVSNLFKSVYIKKDGSFNTYNQHQITLNSTGYYVKKLSAFSKPVISPALAAEGFQLLTNDNFSTFFAKEIMDTIREKESEVSVWKPTKEFMLTNIDLNSFSADIKSNKPLRSIFYLSGYKDQSSIADAVNKVNRPKDRSRLKSKLQDAINDYISKTWKNKIDIVIEISESGTLSFLIKDKGAENEHDRFEITERSEGAQHFLSLLLSLSLESMSHERKDELILIDEPEVHLHPSGIRDLGKELLNVGRENYVFIATHSPFIIDKNHKERHYVVKKNKKAITEIKRIKESDNILDDEVLNEAFGINVYRDLLNPHSILVEGSSDKIILQKVFEVLGRKEIGITNGHGSNIDTLASKMNFDNISVLVIVDDDKDGQKYKENILKIGGVYSENNVFTIRDLEGGIVDEGTIEDTLERDYIKSQFVKYYKDKYGEEPTDFDIVNDKPVISQIIVFLKKKGKYSSWDLDAFKKYVSDNFKPSKKSLEEKNPLIKSLVERILEKLR